MKFEARLGVKILKTMINNFPSFIDYSTHIFTITSNLVKIVIFDIVVLKIIIFYFIKV